MHGYDLSTAVRECVSCHRCYDSTTQFCADCLVELVGIELIPRLLDARYRLDRVIGHGLLGIVFAALDLQAQRAVAVKVIRASAIAEPRAQDRFRREAQLAVGLQHPQLAAVYDHGTLHDASAYTVMELVREVTLRQELKRAGRFTPERAVALLAEVASALDAAHKAGLVHRGLKPEKIALLSTPDQHQPQIKVFDFDFARIASGEHFTAQAAMAARVKGQSLGVPTYLSPEQVRGEEADLRADIYSLGVIAYELLAGRPPFLAPNASELGRKQLTEKPRPLRLLNPEVNALLEAAILKALEKEPMRRQQRAAEFKSDLLAAAQLG
jgi:serine/threonine-protein kinase